MGLCYKYVLNNKISTSGYFNNFNARLHNPKSRREESGWKVFLGGQRGNPVLAVTTNAMTIRPGWEPDIQVLVKEFKTLPTKADPCVGDSEYSQLDCELESFQEVFRDKGGCWLPFMTERSLRTMPKCLTAQAFNDSLKLADRLLFYGNWTRDGCSCLSACNDVTYEAFTDSRVDNTSTTTRVRIFYNDLTYEAVHEDWAYKIISFMCDVGGSLGLLLGASVLTFIEILECVIAYCSQSCCSKKTKVNVIS
ncbi:acid-sensing ion channel 3-like [Macrobrachium rosenbergii]|uniref:acid-sensing ion channel 3-like n=1 Tax=Macrobrachium rosenbergii TaxID=79674 RepID=UPI0034D4160F